MRIRSRRWLVVVVTAGLLLPSSTTLAAPGELPQLREELSQAERDLEAIEAALERAEATIADAVERVDRARVHLATVEADLAAAEHARDVAAAEERAATAAAAEANHTLEAQVDEHQLAKERVRARAVQLHKYGPIHPESTLLRGMTASSDWHEVAVTLETVARVVDHEQQLVASAIDLTREVVDGRAEIVRTRHDAVAAARHTIAEQRRVERLAVDQRRAVERLEDEQADHARVLAALENDAEVREALVARLRQQISELEFDASQVLVPPELQLDLDRPVPNWANRLPSRGRSWAVMIDAVAANRGVDGRLLAAVVWTESNFAPTVVSHAGAIGLAQLMPGTARGLGVDPWDPVQNLDGGARYLRTQLQRFGSIDLALAAYNAGPNRVQAAGPGIPNIVETQLYVVRVIDRYQELAAE
jgi:soluble lytic murein transglycosylase-like protein